MFLNKNTGQIKVIIKDGKPVLSSKIKDTKIVANKLDFGEIYSGSKLHMKIKDYLETIIKDDISVHDLLISK